MNGRLAIGLVHHPVLDKAGDIVTTAMTNLDLHDIARSARTFGVSDYFLIHPIEAQRALAERICAHWIEGSGKRRIPDRATALGVVRVVPSLETAYERLGGRREIDVWTTAASARHGATIPFAKARAEIEASTRTTLLLFGTGWGLAGEVIAAADRRIEPIRGSGDYNHISVRAAVAIALDRLVGAR
jgi:hypothetical protein